MTACAPRRNNVAVRPRSRVFETPAPCLAPQAIVDSLLPNCKGQTLLISFIIRARAELEALLRLPYRYEDKLSYQETIFFEVAHGAADDVSVAAQLPVRSATISATIRGGGCSPREESNRPWRHQEVTDRLFGKRAIRPDGLDELLIPFARQVIVQSPEVDDLGLLSVHVHRRALIALALLGLHRKLQRFDLAQLLRGIYRCSLAGLHTRSLNGLLLVLVYSGASFLYLSHRERWHLPMQQIDNLDCSPISGDKLWPVV